MTAIAWDGRYLATDTRGFDEIIPTNPKHKLDEEDIAHITRAMTDASTWTAANMYRVARDGNRKIFVPTKKVFYGEEPVMAIGISGDTAYLKQFEGFASGYDLGNSQSPLMSPNAKAGNFLVVTKEGLYATKSGTFEDTKNDYRIITKIPRDKFFTEGAAVQYAFNSRDAMMSAEEFVQFSCIQDRLNGGHVDLWDSETNTYVRKPLWEPQEAVDRMSTFHFDLCVPDRSTRLHRNFTEAKPNEIAFAFAANRYEVRNMSPSAKEAAQRAADVRRGRAKPATKAVRRVTAK